MNKKDLARLLKNLAKINFKVTASEEEIKLGVARKDSPEISDVLGLKINGSFVEGVDVSEVVSKGEWKMQEKWFNYPEGMRRMLKCLSSLGFRMATGNAMENFDELYWLKTDGRTTREGNIGDGTTPQLILIYDRDGIPLRWKLT